MCRLVRHREVVAAPFLGRSDLTRPDLLRALIAGPIRDTITKRAMPVTDANLEPRKLCLDQFLKLSLMAESGGHAKFMIQNGGVRVNSEIETRRRRKLVVGDVVDVGGKRLTVHRAE